MAGNKRKKRRKRLTRNSYAIRIVHGTFHEETHDKGERKGQTNEMDHPQDPSFSIDQAIAEPCSRERSANQRERPSRDHEKKEEKKKNDCAKRRVLPKRRSEIFLSYLDGKFSKSNKVNRHSSGRLPR